MRPLIYVAGPYTSHPAHCVRRAVELAEGLLREGFVPFVPHLTLLWDLVSPHTPNFFYRLDDEMIPHCQAMVRIKGESKGSDDEVALALKLGMLVIEVEDVTESEIEHAAALLREHLEAA